MSGAHELGGSAGGDGRVKIYYPLLARLFSPIGARPCHSLRHMPLPGHRSLSGEHLGPSRVAIPFASKRILARSTPLPCVVMARSLAQ